MSNENKALALIDKHMRSSGILAKFSPLLGRDAESYISSVMLAVEVSPGLQECTPDSIEYSALRAATLGLSCDPSLRQAHLVPYRKNIGTKEKPVYIKIATFQPHFMGLYTLAMRTGKYAVIDVLPIPPGYGVRVTPEMEMLIVKEDTETPVVFMPKCKPTEAVGWYGYMRSLKGQVKKVYMTKQEIREHAAKYSKSWRNSDSLWHHKEHGATMEMKTVLLALLKFADMSGSAGAALQDAMTQARQDDSSVIDGVARDLEPDASTIATPAESGDAAGTQPEPQESQPAKSSDGGSKKKKNAEKIITELTGEPYTTRLKAEAEKDLTTAFYKAVLAAGLTVDDGQAMVKAEGSFKKAFDKVLKQYAEVINGKAK